MVLTPMTSRDQWGTHALADRWLKADGFPTEIGGLLASNPATSRARLLLAIPEHQVPLAGGAHAAQTDVWALGWTERGLLSIAIEGNPGSFGPGVGDRQAAATPAAATRWKALRKLLELTEFETAISSQLVHRAACALIEARRFHARAAAVIVHSFSRTLESFGEFQHFVSVMGGDLTQPGELVTASPREGIALHFGWAQGPG